MPEGPSIVILKDEAKGLVGRRIVAVEGNTRIDKERLLGQRVVALRSWGKHFLIELPTFALRVHFMMFGSYRIDARKEAEPRLGLRFARGSEFNLYTCSVRFIDEPLDAVYDWSADVMSDTWDSEAALVKVRQFPRAEIADVLLDQSIFAGVGNIIKNEVLFRTRTSPFERVGRLSDERLKAIVADARAFSFRFLELRRVFALRKHLEVYGRAVCPACGGPLRRKVHGERGRRSFFCRPCQRVRRVPASTSRAR